MSSTQQKSHIAVVRACAGTASTSGPVAACQDGLWLKIPPLTLALHTITASDQA